MASNERAFCVKMQANKLDVYASANYTGTKKVLSYTSVGKLEAVLTQSDAIVGAFSDSSVQSLRFRALF